MFIANERSSRRTSLSWKRQQRRYTRFVLLVIVPIVCVWLPACAHPATDDNPAQSATRPVELTDEGTAVFQGTGNGMMPQKGSGKISARLQILASSPELQEQDTSTQAEVLGLPTQGSGSLMRDQNGNVLVQIRITEITEANLDTLEKNGVRVIQVDEALRTVTAFVAPVDLSSIAALEFVENIREELRP